MNNSNEKLTWKNLNEKHEGKIRKKNSNKKIRNEKLVTHDSLQAMEYTTSIKWGTHFSRFVLPMTAWKP